MARIPFNKLPGSSILSGIVIANGTALPTSVKVNLNAIVPPSVTDDSNAGYKAGSYWIDTAANTAWFCVNPNPGAAIWSPSGGGGGGSSDHDETTIVQGGLLTGGVVRRALASYVYAQADTPTNAEVFGVIKNVAGANVTIVLNGVCDFGAPHGLGANGDVLFLSPFVAGALTTTEPSALGQVSKPIATVMDANRIMVTNMRGVQIVQNNISLPAGQIFVGNGSNLAAAVTMSGDATISQAGVLTVANNAITLGKLASNSVDSSKIVNGSITGTDIGTDTVITSNLAPIAGLVSGSYTNATVVVNTKGQVTAISSGASSASGVNRQIFKSSGNFIVPAGITQFLSKTQAGGGGGGGTGNTGNNNAGGGGGAGGYAEDLATGQVPGTSIPVTVGAGGNGGSGSGSGSDGSNGGNSSVGGLCVATGGQGGKKANLGINGNPGVGGIGTVGDFLIPGKTGTFGDQANLIGGTGADAPLGWGLGGLPGVGTDDAGNDATGYGSGGGGASSDNGSGHSGGDGADGYVIIEW